MLTSINNNNCLLTNGHKEGHIEQKRVEEPRINRTNARYRAEKKHK